MTQIEHITSKGQLVPLVFSQDAVAANQTDVQLESVLTLANDGYVTPFPGEVVGVSFQLSAAATAGQMTIGASIGGVEDTDSTVTVTTAAAGYKRVSRGKVPFVAGAVLGVEITTDASWDALTADLVVIVWALLQLEDV